MWKGMVFVETVNDGMFYGCMWGESGDLFDSPTIAINEAYRVIENTSLDSSDRRYAKTHNTAIECLFLHTSDVRSVKLIHESEYLD